MQNELDVGDSRRLISIICKCFEKSSKVGCPAATSLSRLKASERVKVDDSN